MPTLSEEVQDIINFVTNKYPGLYEEFAAEEIKATIEFILQQDGEIKKIEKSDTYFLGDLGEKFGKCLFSEMIVETPPEKSDFDAIINGKRYAVEVKTLSDLFNSIMVIMYEILKEQKDDRELCDKITYLLRNCDFSMTPLDIHRKRDKDNFKAELKRLLKNNSINFNQQKIFSIKCNNVNYEITIEPKEIMINGISSVFCGRPPNKIKQLADLFEKKRFLNQILKTDILLIVLLNRISFDEITKFIYRRWCLYLKSIEEVKEIKNKQEARIPMITQYEKIIWLQPSFQRLKCIIFIYPSSKCAWFCPSINYFANFNAPEYFFLTKKLKGKGISSNFAYLNIATTSIE